MAKKLDKVDVVTVGVGWTGGIVAAELTKAGYKVVGLERGEEQNTKDFFQLDELRYDFRQEMMQDLTESTVTYRNNLDQTANPVRDPGDYAAGIDVGGAGVHWGGQVHRYFPYDFEIRSKTIEKYGEDKIPKDMTLQDWGITYDEIEPYYDKMEKTIGASGEEAPFAGERSDSYPTPPHKKTDAMKLFEKASKNLEYHPYVIPSANLSEGYENPDGEKINACQFCAFCSFYGCEHDAKSSPNLTVIPTAKKTGNYELRTGSNVKRIIYEGNKAKGVIYEDTKTGEEFEQPADIVAMTAFTFNNVRLLLLSEIGTPYNPKTGEGIIGKNYCMHAITPIESNGFFDEKFNLYVASDTLGMTLDDFNADNFDHSDLDFIHGGHFEVRSFGNLPIAYNQVPSDTPSWGRDFKENSLYYHNRKINFFSQMFISPHKENYMDLDPTYTDSNGDPLLRITNDHYDNERKISEYLAEKAEKVLKEMGAQKVDSKSGLGKHAAPQLEWEHDSGGAIMGDDPSNSAVNNYSQMWDMNNLFIFGATVFPQFGPTNPTLTLGALAYRATEGMIEYLENGGGQLVNTKETKQRV